MDIGKPIRRLDVPEPIPAPVFPAVTEPVKVPQPEPVKVGAR